jgi:putative membrane-bound dehydrogenase-like protein
MMACFDDRGRLFVAESAGVNLPTEKELTEKLVHFIRLLEDTDGDGRFDKTTVFADRMVYPQGVVWHDGALYTASPPSLWRLEDTDGDGRADKRQEIVTGFRIAPNAASIHGPFLAPSGRLYWTKGFHGDHRIMRPDGSVLQGIATSLFRARPDGTEVEVVCGGGMHNLIEVAFTAEGEALATTTSGSLRPRRSDWIIHGVEGGAFPAVDEARLREFRRTGDLLPAVSELGFVSPSGLARYRSGSFGPDYRDNLFTAQYNARRVQRHGVKREGATLRAASNEDFLVSSRPDFRPTDVLEDADGSLLVVDTGGWNTLACASATTAKPEVKGAIYRIRRKGASRVADPWGLKVRWSGLEPRELVRLLEDPRFAVRDRAIAELARRGGAALEALEEAAGNFSLPMARRNAVWALTRIGGAKALAAIRSALGDRDESVRLAAAHGAGLHRDREALIPLMERVKSDTPSVSREAATALGRLRAPEAIPALFDGLRGGADRFLEHSIVFALLAIDDPEAVRRRLSDPSPEVRRAALIALDGLPGGRLTLDQVKPHLDPSHPELQQAALRIVMSHPGWAKELVGLLRTWLSSDDLSEGRAGELSRLLVAFAADPSIQDLMARVLRREKTSAGLRVLLLEAMGWAPLKTLPPPWTAELRWSLDHPDERVVRQAVATLRAAGVTACDHALLDLARDPRKSEELRAEALLAAAPRLGPMEKPLFDFLAGCVAKEKPVLLRLTAAQALGEGLTDGRHLDALAGLVAKAGPLELPRLLAAFGRVRQLAWPLAIGGKLVEALKRSPALESLSPDLLRSTFREFPPEVRDLAEPLFKRLEADAGKMKARLLELEPLLSGGDADRGREVFFGRKAACAACHSVNGQGGKVAPDLSKIGAARSPGDLLEAVVFPSASIVRGYEPLVVKTVDDSVYDGVKVHETAEAIYLFTSQRIQKPIVKSSIREVREGRLSIMPQGLEAQLGREELRDLMAFLQFLR